MTEGTGELCVLNVGAGDIRVVFNQHDTGESAKALRMLRDMMARGYLVAVELPDGSYARARSVDASRGRYVITVPEDAAVPADAEPVPARRGKKAGKKAGKRVSVPVRTSKAVGVARSAGG